MSVKNESFVITSLVDLAAIDWNSYIGPMVPAARHCSRAVFVYTVNLPYRTGTGRSICMNIINLFGGSQFNWHGWLSKVQVEYPIKH